MDDSADPATDAEHIIAEIVGVHRNSDPALTQLVCN
jgi:hypothetical protein